MRRLATVSSVLAVAFCLFHAASPACAGSTPWRWTEDFSGLLGRDAALTTADWDTSAGELHLPRLEMEIVGAFDTPGSAAAVAAAGGLAFVADGASGLQILSLADPQSPANVGAIDTPGLCLDVSLHQPFALLADGSGGYQCVDVSDPAAPVGAGSFATAAFAYSIDVQGNVAVLAIGALGVQFLDVTDPANPLPLATLNTPGTAFNAVFSGRWVFVADGSAGLRVIDAADPAAPVLAGLYDTSGTCYDVLVAGGRAYLADYGYGVLVLDASAPATPTFLGSYDTAGQARGLALDGPFLHVADSGNGVLVLDVADPAAIAPVHVRDTPGLASGVAVMSEFTLAADATAGLQVMRHRHLGVEPALVAATPATPYEVSDFLTDGPLVYVASYSGLKVFDLGDPQSPQLIGSLAVGCGALDGDGSRLVAVAGSELAVVDAGDPAAPALVGVLVLHENGEDVAVDGRYAYVAAGMAGLVVVDLTDPAAPLEAAILTLPGSSHAVAVEGDRLCVAAQHGGLIVVDVSDPLVPVVLGSHYGAGNVIDVAMAGRYAFTTEYYGDDVRMLDVSDPAAIVEIDALDVTRPRQIAVDGRQVAFAAQEGLRIADFGPSGGFANVRLLPLDELYAVGFCGDDVLVKSSAAGHIDLVRYAQRHLDPVRNIGQGGFSATAAGTILEARLTAAQTGAIAWFADADGGADLQPIPNAPAWSLLSGAGQAPTWRAVLAHDFSATGPVCDALTFEVLRDVPVIDAVADVPGDQGGQVRLRWARSSYDREGGNPPIASYSVYRRVEDGAAAAAARDPLGAADRAWPPGEWDYLVTVPADREDLYSVVVPTLYDSTAAAPRRATFFVRARADVPGVVFDAPPDSGCSADNLAPAAPGVFTVAYTAGGNLLAWGAPAGGDVVAYRLYRGAAPGFTPAPENLLGETALTAWLDRAAEPWAWSYLVAAVDRAGNEGPAAAPDALTGAPGAEPPAAFALRGAAPNPFNPSTTFSFDVPAGGGDVRLDVLDARGRIVRTLVAERRGEGRHEAVWNGRDGAGRRLPSGVYFARLRAAGCREVIKVTLAG
ncbi:MAG: hypothetical protein IPM94_08925 [bacterium]|nr:hypothetical protein [bacterium]